MSAGAATTAGPRWQRARPGGDLDLRHRCGPPTYGLTDNERTVTIDRVAGIPVRHPELVAAGRHDGSQIIACRPALNPRAAVRRRSRSQKAGPHARNARIGGEAPGETDVVLCGQRSDKWLILRLETSSTNAAARRRQWHGSMAAGPDRPRRVGSRGLGPCRRLADVVPGNECGCLRPALQVELR